MLFNRTIAVIGTAGRDKERASQMTPDLWNNMLGDIYKRVRPVDVLVSGGAAWADHLAVCMYLCGRVSGLRLHLPATFNTATLQFIGGLKSSGAAANYYHARFIMQTGHDSLRDLRTVINDPRVVKTMQPSDIIGYGSMKARNKLIAHDADYCIAYTWGAGEIPADGGTKDTWDQICGDKHHVSLQRFGS